MLVLPISQIVTKFQKQSEKMDLPLVPTQQGPLYEEGAIYKKEEL